MTYAGTDTWGYWTGTDCTAAGATQWGYWTSSDVGTSGATTHVTDYGVYVPWTQWVDVQHLTEEQRARFAEAAEQQRVHCEAAHKAEAERQEKQRVTEARAEALLKQYLTPEQVASYEREKWFFVRSQTGKQFRVKQGESVAEYDDNKMVAKHCIHHDYGIPPPDTMLHQKLMLEYEEDRFRQIANRTEIRA